MGSYQRRWDDWKLQEKLAGLEIKQIDRQIVAAGFRQEIAERDLANQDLQIEQSAAIAEYLRAKFTNQELYSWMVQEISRIYFQAYTLTYDLAKRAERAMRHELGLTDSSFVQFGYWDSLRRGLLAGDRLSQDLRRMETTYLEKNKREYEITRHISLAQLDPLAFIQLKETGQCTVATPEALFDIDFPGHYLRRIKSLSLTIPCVTGPYTGVICTLTQVKSSIRHANTLLAGRYARQPDEATRFTDSYGLAQSVVTSTGQNDNGLFEGNLRDERLLPFEGTGVIGEWRLEMPPTFRPFDYDTISDVILHVRYTAREGGGTLKQQARAELDAALNDIATSAEQPGLARIFSLRHEFPNEWHRFLRPTGSGDQTLTLLLTRNHFPFLVRDRTITVSAMDIFIKVQPDFISSHNETTLVVTLDAGISPGVDTVALAPWHALLRGSRQFSGALQPWTLEAHLEPSINVRERLHPEALADLVLVCRYTI